MLACLLIGVLLFTTGECPSNPIIKKEGEDIVLPLNVNGENLKNNTVDLKKFNESSNKFIVLIFYRYGEITPVGTTNKSRFSFNRADLESGVVNAIISSATLSDSGLYQIHIPGKMSSNFTVMVNPWSTSGQNNSVHNNRSPPPDQTNNTTDGGDRTYTPTFISFSVFIIFILIICLRKKSHKQQEEGRNSCDLAANDSAAAEQLLNPPEPTTSSSNVKR